MMTFYCFKCTRHKPLAQVNFTKDVMGRTRRICSGCLIHKLKGRAAA